MVLFVWRTLTNTPLKATGAQFPWRASRKINDTDLRISPCRWIVPDTPRTSYLRHSSLCLQVFSGGGSVLRPHADSPEMLRGHTQGTTLNQWDRYMHIYLCIYQLVQLFSHIQLFATPWTAACQTSLMITNSWSLLKLMSIKLAMTSNHLILCPLLQLPSIFPSIRFFSNESALRNQKGKVLELQL